MTPLSFHIRPLCGNDWRAYRALRQQAAELGEGKYFGNEYEREAALGNEEKWREWCTERREHCIIGIFADEELIGDMMITQFGDVADLTAEWEATWIDPVYRRMGVARRAYEAVEAWTRAQGYASAVVWIRHDNHRSREIREKQGFRCVRTKYGKIWADGSIADAHFFRCDLRDEAITVSLRKAS